MLAIKLSKTGKTNKKMFRIIVSEKSRDPYGNVLEILGSYNPHTKELLAKTDRIKHWLSNGAQMTATINNLLLEKKIIEGKKTVASKPGKKSDKRTAQIKAKDDKRATAKAASIKEKEVPETPAETSEVESPAETSTETSEIEAQVEIPTETPVEPPAETPTETPVK